MKPIISKLREKITLQKNNESISKTTEPMFCDVLNLRASITSLSMDDLYEIIILKPPTKFRNINFSGVKWKGVEYKYTSNLSNYKDKFLKGTISKIA